MKKKTDNTRERERGKLKREGEEEETHDDE